MDEEALDADVGGLVKKLGVTAQQEIEKAVRDADAKGNFKMANDCRRRLWSRWAASISNLRSTATSNSREDVTGPALPPPDLDR